MAVTCTYVRYNREDLQSNFVERTIFNDGLVLVRGIKSTIIASERYFKPEAGTISQFWADWHGCIDYSDDEVGDRAYVEITDEGIRYAFSINNNILSAHEYLASCKEYDETTENWYDENTTLMSQEQVKEFMNTDFILADYSK